MAAEKLMEPRRCERHAECFDGSRCYDLPFSAAATTLFKFGRNELGAQLGITTILHTWSHALQEHYHLHCIVTGGGLREDGG